MAAIASFFFFFFYLGRQHVYSLKDASQFVCIGGNHHYVVDIDKKFYIRKFHREGGVKTFVDQHEQGWGERAALFYLPRKSIMKILKVVGGAVVNSLHQRSDGLWCADEFQSVMYGCMGGARKSLCNVK